MLRTSQTHNFAVLNQRALTGAAKNAATKRGITMDKDRIAGAAKQAKGAMKDAAGKLTGDAKLQAEGKAEKAEGKIQNAVGGMKDKIKK
jgi:uncharacterized protein YjbJ (UPF0337 family)